MAKFSPELTKLLQHFGSFAGVTKLTPNEPVCVCNSTKTIYAMAEVDIDADLSFRGQGIPVADIGSLNSTIRLFQQHETNDVEVVDNYLQFKSGKFKQRIYLCDPSLLEGSVPKLESMQNYFGMDVDVEFDLPESDLETFMSGAKNTKADTICLATTEEGNIMLFSASVDDAGQVEEFGSRFEYNTGIETDQEFNIGFRRDVFVILPGSYRVGITANFVTFRGQTVSYLIPLLQWSSVE